jgi:hypothetical protein
VHKAAVNSPLLDRVVAAALNNQLPLHKAAAAEPEAVKQVAAVVAAVKRTLLRQAPETFGRSFSTGAGIWACCAATRKSI